ncbi:unnamed protein product [Rhizoctonia solani]|uniref:Uncharacterized protein n=1 Tax=Rhizoctonia solani TaxID=456999 RepID=A0A8H3A8W7_9AGAM|nr:unnamed protein product [Rhizoctonia solani]
MRTREELTPFNPEKEREDDWEAELDGDSQTLQHKQNNTPKAPESLPDKQGRKGPINVLENKTGSIAVGIIRLRNSVVSICNLQVVKIVTILYLVFLVPPVLSGYCSHCASELDLPREAAPTPDFITLARLQSRLEQVMKDSASSSKVAVGIKTSEAALQDLGTIVKHSALSKKDILERDIKSFVEDAKITGANLQRFGSRIWGAVDRVISLNEHTVLILESTSPGGEGNEGSQSWWGQKEEAHRGPDPKDVENIWWQGIDLLSKTLHKLIHEAQHNVVSLQRLGERLNSIEDTVAQEKGYILGREKVLKDQWFRELFGMNNGEWHSHSVSHALLERVKDDRQHALKHVNGVLLKLNQMSKDLEDLRVRVAEPLIIPGSPNIPIKKYIKHIRDATERLVNGQTNMREIESL